MPAHAVILAGGRGTRFWPRSRVRTPKQLLNIVGERTMLQQTVARIAPVFPPSRVWLVTNQEQVAAVRRQVPQVRPGQILVEPVGRNTAAAIGLAAVHLLHQARGDALMAVLPADHYIAQARRYLGLVRAALAVAGRGEYLVVLGIRPASPATGYGYIERGPQAMWADDFPVCPVRRFTEKPAQRLAKRYVASGRFDWNAGMFFWRVSTFLENLHRFLPATHRALLYLAETIGTRRYEATLRRTYLRLENISVDYALLEPASRHPGPARVFALRADVGWSDIGSWAAVYELLAKRSGANVSVGRFLAVDASGNFFWSPKKFLAAVGLQDLVVVDTPDALLLCARDRAQDVGRVVRWLEARRFRQLL